MVCHDLRVAQSSPVAVLLQDSRAVSSLAFEDPWLACGTAAGVASLVNVEEALRGPAPGGAGTSSVRKRGGPMSLPRPRRQLQGPGGAVFSVDLASGWLAVCGEAATVRTYRFSARGGAGEPCEPQRRSRAAVLGTSSVPRSPLIRATDPAHACPLDRFSVALEPMWEPISAES